MSISFVGGGAGTSQKKLVDAVDSALAYTTPVDDSKSSHAKDALKKSLASTLATEMLVYLKLEAFRQAMNPLFMRHSNGKDINDSWELYVNAVTEVLRVLPEESNFKYAVSKPTGLTDSGDEEESGMSDDSDDTVDEGTYFLHLGHEIDEIPKLLQQGLPSEVLERQKFQDFMTALYTSAFTCYKDYMFTAIVKLVGDLYGDCHWNQFTFKHSVKALVRMATLREEKPTIRQNERESLEDLAKSVKLPADTAKLVREFLGTVDQRKERDNTNFERDAKRAREKTDSGTEWGDVFK